MDGNRANLVKRYVIMVVSIVAVFAVLIGAVLLVSSMFKGNDEGEAGVTPNPISIDNTPSASAMPSGGIWDDLFKAPDRTTALILGVDEGGGLADTQLLVTFDAVNNIVDIISVPRDTYIVLPESEVRSMQQIGRWCPNDGVMKLNELHSYAGSDKGYEYMQRQYERMFGITIDYYAIVGLSAFRSIVDDVDGIDFVVRPEGYYYNPPDQDLVINIPGGPRKLNGIEAEGVFRFREGQNAYANGDLGRIAVQQEFMKAFFTQVLAREELMNNLPALLSTFISYVRTDFGLDGVAKYIASLGEITEDGVHFHRMPGVGDYIGDTSYYVLNENEVQALINEVFHRPDMSKDTSDSEQTNAPSALKIQVLNGGAGDGMAGKTRDVLAADGYTVVNTGNYDGTQKMYTRILVRTEAEGRAFLSYFKAGAQVEVDATLPSAYDVVIILGKSE